MLHYVLLRLKSKTASLRKVPEKNYRTLLHTEFYDSLHNNDIHIS